MRFDDYADVLERELAEEAREHARDERYHFLGPVKVELIEDPRLRKGDLEVEASIKEGEGGRVGALVLHDGRRITLGADAFVDRAPRRLRPRDRRPTGLPAPRRDPPRARRLPPRRPRLAERHVGQRRAREEPRADRRGRRSASARCPSGSRRRSGRIACPKACSPSSSSASSRCSTCSCSGWCASCGSSSSPTKVAVPVAPAGAGADRPPPYRQADQGRRRRAVARRCCTCSTHRRARGEVYAIDEEVTVGRAPGCGVVLEDDTFVSQVHARLFRRGRETYVEDLGSTNGTIVNGERIDEVTRLSPRRPGAVRQHPRGDHQVSGMKLVPGGATDQGQVRDCERGRLRRRPPPPAVRRRRRHGRSPRRRGRERDRARGAAGRRSRRAPASATRSPSANAAVFTARPPATTSSRAWARRSPHGPRRRRRAHRPRRRLPRLPRCATASCAS